MYAGKIMRKLGFEKRGIKGKMYWRMGEVDTLLDLGIDRDFY